MLKCNPTERITAKAALEHLYFKDIPENIKAMYKNVKWCCRLWIFITYLLYKHIYIICNLKRNVNLNNYININ